MFTKIATILTIVTLALGGVGIVAASAQSDNAQGGTLTQTMQQAFAKFIGDDTIERPVRSMNAARSGNLAQDPFEFRFGTTGDEFVPGNPWAEDTVGTLEVSGFGFGGRVDEAPKGSIDE